MICDNQIKVLIIEDELIIAEDMSVQLEELGYCITGIASSYVEAVESAEKNIPDIILADIQIKGETDGIQTASYLKKKYNLPVIFLTSFSNKSILERAKEIKPNSYLIKPFNIKELYTSIEIAFFNHATKSDKSPEEKSSFSFKDSIFIKKDHLLVKIRFSELKYIKAEGNYIELYCKDKKFLTRSTLKEFVSKLPEEKFIQVHKSYAVNIDCIDFIEYNNLIIDKDKIPVSRNMQSELARILQIDL